MHQPDNTIYSFTDPIMEIYYISAPNKPSTIEKIKIRERETRGKVDYPIFSAFDSGDTNNI